LRQELRSLSVYRTVGPLGEAEVFSREDTVVAAVSVGKTEELGKANEKEAQGTADGLPWTDTCRYRRYVQTGTEIIWHMNVGVYRGTIVGSGLSDTGNSLQYT
jgi:hypothetical protein